MSQEIVEALYGAARVVTDNLDSIAVSPLIEPDKGSALACLRRIADSLECIASTLETIEQNGLPK